MKPARMPVVYIGHGSPMNALVRGDASGLVAYEHQQFVARALPTSEHCLPLLYALGAAGPDRPRFLSPSY